MYALWTKLTTIEDVLIDNAEDVVNYLRTNYFTPTQQIRSMLSERAAPLKRISFQESSPSSFPFRFLSESDSPFDALCDYVGFVLYTYDGKNEGPYQRGDILIKDINNIPNSSSILRSPNRNQQVYNNLFKSLITSNFKKAYYERFVGLGITYEQYKWKFDTFIIGSESKRSIFSPDEQRLLEMYVLLWTKNMNDARVMLNEQLNYVKGLLETQRLDMEKFWSPNEVDIAIKTFEYESQDEINALFQRTPSFNTFSNILDKLQAKDENQLDLIAEIFNYRQLTSKTSPSEPSLYRIWRQLKTVEIWLREKDFNSLNNFLALNTFVSVESLFTLPVPIFLNQLGICPKSDLFDPTFNYIGFLIYLHDDQDEFIVNKHQCRRGQLLIRQKEKFSPVIQTPTYRQRSFAPLFIHECLYEWYFKEEPNEHFHGLAFAYEENQWKFNIITYAGKQGTYSIYDTRDDYAMAPNKDEQHCLDLILSSIYINNRWKEELGRMYTIEELQSMGRELFRRQIEIVEKLNGANFDTNYQIGLKNFIGSCRPKPLVVQRRKVPIQESPPDVPPLIITNSEPENNAKKSLPIDPPEQPQPEESPPIRSRKKTTTQKPKNSFWGFGDRIRRTSSLQDVSSTTNTLPTPSSTKSDENEKNVPPKAPIASKEKEARTFYQLWRELNVAEQLILSNLDLTQFINYLTKTEYVNYSESVPFLPPDDQTDEYNLMAEMKIESQLKFLSKLFALKRSKLFPDHTNQEKKALDDLIKAFENHYNTQIEKTKKHLKSNKN